jgi:hypothetical protein
MVEPRHTETSDDGAKLPLWLQCIVALIGVVALAGPAAAVVWYR